MQIFIKQSIGCVYKVLHDSNYKEYTYYSKDVKLVADSPYCTSAQISQGYLIEFYVFMLLAALGVGIGNRYMEKSDKFGFVGGVFTSALTSLVVMLVVNVIVLAWSIVTVVALTILAVGLLFLIGNHIDSPLKLWRNYQHKKEQAAQKRLKDAQIEINRLRASDPQLNIALQSLDEITTALNN